MQPLWKNPLFQILAILGGTALVFLLVVALAGGMGGPPGRTPGPLPTRPTAGPTAVPTPSPLPPSVDRSDLALVHSRVVVALKSNNPAAIFNEMSPEDRAATDYTSLVQSSQEVEQSLGPIQEVRLLTPPLILNDPPWNGQWAEAEVEIVWPGETGRYRVIYLLSEGNWWLFGTEELTSTVRP